MPEAVKTDAKKVITGQLYETVPALSSGGKAVVRKERGTYFCVVKY